MTETTTSKVHMAHSQEKNYQKLCELSKHTRLLQGISSILDWDQETYMPPGSALIRAEQLEAMAGIIHKEKTGKIFFNALSKLIDIPTGKIKSQTLSPEQRAAVKEWRRKRICKSLLTSDYSLALCSKGECISTVCPLSRPNCSVVSTKSRIPEISRSPL